VSSTNDRTQASPESRPAEPGAAGAHKVTLAELAQLRQAATDLHRRITDDLARLARIDPLSEHDERASA
jgi:hypothetical protein